MKSRNIKTRLAAFGLALLMGISPLGNLADVHAAEIKNPSEPVTESAEISETEQTEEVSEAAKHLVTAEDITKDISDKDFMAETCMEGIHYNPEQEDVTLERIEAEDGGSYHPDQAGTYIATYWVVPKDERDGYSVTRKIILTDTEGQAHTEENGGQKQKEDTNSEEDSETPVQEIPDVEVTVSGEGVDAQAARELEEKIEDGEVMMLSGAENTFRARETVHLEKGETIYYPSYIGNYLTCWFTVNGKIAYCLESHRASPPSGDYVAQVLDSNKNLQKVLYYGYGGAGDITGSYLSGKSAEEKYVYTHIAASYAYAGEAGFTGCKYEDLVNAGVIAYIDHLFAMEEPPKGEISLSKTSVKAVRNGNVQKTPDITLSGDHRNYISVQVPKDITIYNKTKGTSAENGALKIYGGDTFYLTAPMLHTGKYSSGELHGSVGETWRTLVLSTGNSNQDIGVFESEKANPVSFTVDWLEMTRIELFKQDADTKNPLDGAVYGIYTDSKCEHLLMEMPVTGEEGKAVSDYFEAAIKTVYVKEIKAPDKYAQSDVIHKVDVEAGKTVTISATDERVKGAVHIQKIDKETQAFLPQGDSSLAGAVYGLYAREDIVHPDGKTGVLFKKDSLIAQGVIKEDGTLDFSELYLGKMYVKEITPPEGYTVDPTEYEVDLAYEGQEVAEVTRDLTVQEQVKKQAFQLIKISEDGNQTETDLVEGAGFQVYLVSSLSKVESGELQPSNGDQFTAEDFRGYDFSKEEVAVTYVDGKAVPVPELITDKKGYALSPELPYGLYVVEESTVPENLKAVDPFLVKVDEDSREPMVWRVFDDRPFEFLLKIVKKDAQTGNPVLKAGASYKIFDMEKEEYVEQTVFYPKKETISVFKTNEEGYLVTPEELKCSTYRIEEVKAPEGFVRPGYESSLYEGKTVISPLEVTEKGSYKENAKEGIVITVSSDTAHQIDPDTGAVIVEVEQPNDEQVGSLTLTKTGEQPVEVKGDSLLAKAKRLAGKIKDAVTGEDTDTGVFHDFVYEESGVEGATFELYAKDTIYSPDGAKNEQGNPVIRYEKDDLVATLVTDKEGKAVVNNLPLGSYYLKETVAGDHFVLNPEQKEFTLTAKDDTQAVVYEGVAYKNERQKISISVEKKDAVTEEKLEGVIFGLYAKEDILSQQGEVLVEKDTLLEKKATDENGQLTFDSDLYHGKYYVKEEVRKPGYLPNEEIWEVDASYTDQNLAEIKLTKEVENQPTESQFTKTDATTGEELEGAKLQIIDKEGNIVEEWISAKEPHVVYGLPEGTYILHEELPPYAEGYVSAEDIEFEVKEDGSVTKVEMKDDYSKVEISKTDITTGEELEGAKLQILNKEGEILEEWVTDGKPHLVEKLPVGEELTLREITAPEGYEIAEDVKFTLEDTMEIQKVEMKDARTPETPGVPQTGDDHWKPILLFVLLGASAAGLMATMIYKKKHGKTEKADETKKEE